METNINVLSLFDGMSCGQIALRELGIEVDNYYASEDEFRAYFKPRTELAPLDIDRPCDAPDNPKIWDRLPESIKRDGIIYALVIGRVKNWIIGYQFIDPDWEVEHLFSVEAPDFETCCQKALDTIKE